MHEPLERGCRQPRTSLRVFPLPPAVPAETRSRRLHRAAGPDRRHDDAGRRAAITTPSRSGFNAARRRGCTGLRERELLPQGPVVQPHGPRHSRLPRDGALRRVPLLPRRRDAAVLSAVAAVLPLDRHVRRVHPDSLAHSVARSRCSTSASPARSRDSSSRCRCSSSAGAVGDRALPERLSRRRARRAAALPRRRVGRLGHAAATACQSTCTRWSFAAWFGLLATALNLFPAGQLDGGHVAYAVLGRRSTQLTLATVIAAVGLTVYSTGWLVWTILMVADDRVHRPASIRRRSTMKRRSVAGDLIMAVVGVVMLILCFTPAPLGDFPGGN